MTADRLNEGERKKHAAWKAGDNNAIHDKNIADVLPPNVLKAIGEVEAEREARKGEKAAAEREAALKEKERQGLRRVEIGPTEVGIKMEGHFAKRFQGAQDPEQLIKILDEGGQAETFFDVPTREAFKRSAGTIKTTLEFMRQGNATEPLVRANLKLVDERWGLQATATKLVEGFLKQQRPSPELQSLGADDGPEHTMFVEPLPSPVKSDEGVFSKIRKRIGL